MSIPEPFLLHPSSADYLAGKKNGLLARVLARDPFAAEGGPRIGIALAAITGLALIAHISMAIQAHDDERFRLLQIVGIMLIIFIPSVIAIVYGHQRFRSLLRLVNEGTCIPGTVLSSSGGCTGNGDEHDVYQLTVQYEFISPQGKTIRAEDVAHGNELAKKPLPPLGHPVLVLYLSARDFVLL